MQKSVGGFTVSDFFAASASDRFLVHLLFLVHLVRDLLHELVLVVLEVAFVPLHLRGKITFQRQQSSTERDCVKSRSLQRTEQSA